MLYLLNAVFTRSVHILCHYKQGFRKKSFVQPVYNSLQLFHIIELKTINHEQNEY